MKDNFSGHSSDYAKYRPAYPEDLYNALLSLVGQKEHAWDCGTGNGQVARVLAGHFQQVFATDISAPQIAQAIQAGNITYSVQPAEQTTFPDHHFDLVIVAQAIHWFDFDRFYREVHRTLRPQGIFTAIGYGLAEISPEIDTLVHHLYEGLIGPYWDPERRYIEENYQTIPFPFHEVPMPHFESRYEWPANRFLGYLNTWSAVKHFIREKGQNPVDQISGDLIRMWGASRLVRFPLILRVGKLSGTKNLL